MASAFRRELFFHLTRGVSGKDVRRRVTKAEAARLQASGERVEVHYDRRWYVRYRDAGGAWRDERTTAGTKAEALRLAIDLERRAERQRHGLEPLPGDPGMSLGELCRWWLREKCPPQSVKREESRLRNQLLNHAIAELPLGRVTAVRFEERLREMERAGLGANTINHLRVVVSGIFKRAGKAGLWYGPNPIDGVERRREVERGYVTLRAHEVAPFLKAAPPQWRDLYATTLYLGLRKGEVFALRKSDVDLTTMTVTVQRSHERATTKGGHVDTLPIHPQLLPYLVHAMAASGSEYMFPRSDGKAHTTAINMARLTQVICVRAGVIEGYDHWCRRCKRNGAPHLERHPDDGKRKCPQCGMQLWVKAIPRPLRFHDLRHTYGTLLAQAGFDGVRLQRAMRHRDFKMTARYVHTNVEDLRAAAAFLPPSGAALVELPTEHAVAPDHVVLEAPKIGVSASRARQPARLAGSLLYKSEPSKKRGPGSSKNSKENPALPLARPRGFEPLAFGFVVCSPY
jgi:integrase